MIKQVITELDIHFARIDNIIPEINSHLPFKTDDFDNVEKIKTIDAFIYRFSKIQDVMGEKFFPAALKELQEYKDNMSLIDVLNKLEKLRLLDTNYWIDCRKLRNNLVHEYPDNYDNVAQAINIAVKTYGNIKKIYKKIGEKVC